MQISLKENVFSNQIKTKVKKDHFERKKKNKWIYVIILFFHRKNSI